MSISFRIKDEKVISADWGRLMSVTYEMTGRDGAMQQKDAEIYDKGNAVAVLLYNKEKGTVLLTRQFRLATTYKGNKSGMLMEVCAGVIEDLSPAETIRKEIKEETGYLVHEITPVMKVFMSPGVFTEMLHLYVAAYSSADKKGPGGGLEEEGEQIELLEVPYAKAMDMIADGEIIDAKTVILLQYAGLHGLL